MPTQKGPSEPPAPPAAGAAARTGLLWRRQGLLVMGSLLGAWGQVGAGGERSFTPPAPAGAMLAQGHSRRWVSVSATAPVNSSSTHSPAQEQIQTCLAPKPCSVSLWGHGTTQGDSSAPCLGLELGAGASPQARMERQGQAGFSPSTFLEPFQHCQLLAGHAEGAAG